MESRKILLTNHSLDKTTGSETYCYNLALRFSKHHEVYVWTPTQGKMSEKISEFATILDKPEGNFDYIFYNHNNTISENFHSKCKIFTMQGIFPELEQPPLGMDAYVAISDEIAQYHQKLKPYIIRNGIDTEYYRETPKAQKTKNVLFSSNYRSKFPRTLKFACASLGLKFRRIGDKNLKYDILPDLEWADIVIGLGRTTLEAMSCNKKIIVADKRDYSDVGMDGFLTPANVTEIQQNNFSGRRYKKPICFLTIREELKKAIKISESWERDYILQNFNIDKVVQNYITLAEQIVSSKEI